MQTSQSLNNKSKSTKNTYDEKTLEMDTIL